MSNTTVQIDFDESTLGVERDRPIEELTEDDVLWCYGADITIRDNSEDELYVESALFYFTKVLLEISRMVLSQDDRESFSEPYDAYRLEVEYSEGMVSISDEYGGGNISLPLKELLMNYAQANNKAIEKLIANNPALSKCECFKNVVKKQSKEIERSIAQLS